jgi:4-carboxymuconolactone decarboxylase
MSGALPPDVVALVRLSAALAAGDADELDAALGRAATDAQPREVEEALLQSHLFLGYPAALNGLAAWRAHTQAPAPPPVEAAPEGWSDRGAEVCRAVYGDQYEALRDNVRRIHPELDTWMVAEGYGRVLGRPGLPLERRELCIVAILARQGASVERQLYSHLRGALRVGASERTVGAALDVALVDAPGPVRAGARAVWERVRARSDRDGPA